MKINPIWLSILICSSTFSNSSYSQEFILKCSKYYSGSQSSDTFNILVSDDKSTGLMVHNDRDAYRLKIASSGNTYYDFTTIPYVSATDSFSWFSYRSISINRQNLKLSTTVRKDEYPRVIDCQKDTTDIRKLVEKVEAQAIDYKQKKQRDEILKKEKLQKEAQF